MKIMLIMVNISEASLNISQDDIFLAWISIELQSTKFMQFCQTILHQISKIWKYILQNFMPFCFLSRDKDTWDNVL